MVEDLFNSFRDIPDCLTIERNVPIGISRLPSGTMAVEVPL
jgi:hypothetical protein